MMFSQPYDTNTGKMTKVSVITNNVVKYITQNSNEDFSYGYPIGGLQTYYIIGKNRDEKDLLIWDFPLFFKDVRNRPSVAINLRPYVVNADKPFTTLKDIVRDKNGVVFQQVLAYLSNKQNEDIHFIKPILDNIGMGFVAIIQAAVKRITTLTPQDKASVEIACLTYIHYLHNINVKLEDDTERISNFVSKARLSYPYDKKQIRKLVEEITILGNMTDNNFEVLSKLLRNALPGDMGEVVNLDVVINMLDNGWFGPGSNKSIFIGFEYLPMLTTLLYSCSSTTLYKNTKIGVALEADKRRVDLPAIESFIFNRVIKHEIGEL